MEGRVVSVARSPRGGVPKFVEPEVRVTPLGVEGDHHAGATRYSTRLKVVVPNERPVSVVAVEALAAINAELGTALKAGDFAENILVEGFGDLSDLAPGDRLVVEGAATRVELRVSEQNMPCSQLLPYHPHMVKTALRIVDGRKVNRRGVLCTVLAVVGDGRVAPGARVRLVRGA